MGDPEDIHDEELKNSPEVPHETPEEFPDEFLGNPTKVPLLA